jgi:hypothetical protein
MSRSVRVSGINLKSKQAIQTHTGSNATPGIPAHKEHMEIRERPFKVVRSCWNSTIRSSFLLNEADVTRMQCKRSIKCLDESHVHFCFCSCVKSGVVPSRDGDSMADCWPSVVRLGLCGNFPRSGLLRHGQGLMPRLLAPRCRCRSAANIRTRRSKPLLS